METQNQAHPSPGQLSAFALGKLKPEGQAKVEQHVASCETCAAFLAETPSDTFVDLLRQAVSDRKSQMKSTPGVARGSTEAGLSSPRPSVSRMQRGESRGLSLSDVAAGNLGDDSIPEPLLKQTKYKVLRLLGRGGMGSVYEAYHERMDRTVAIKVINPSLVDHPEALKRFDQEVRTAAQLNHPNVTRAYDADEFDDLRVLVMEYIPGSSLDKLLAKNGPFSVADACRITRQVAQGLQHAHEKGTVHRDLKPQNLMLSSEDRKVRILDFGLGKLASENQKRMGLTRENALMGTPDYLAPEQALDAAKADIRADIYSLGCTLYCLLTGSPPFAADTEMKILMAHQQETARPLSEVRPDVPQELSDCVAKMLAKDPAERPQMPAEVASALLQFVKQAKGAPEKQASFLDAISAQSVAAPIQSVSAEVMPVTRPRWTSVAGLLGAIALFVATAAIGLSYRTKYGTIVIDKVPVGAEVLIDGEKVTVARAGDSATIEAVPVGPHHLRLVQDGRETWTSDATVKVAGAKVRVSFEAEEERKPESPREEAVVQIPQESAVEPGFVEAPAEFQREGLPPAIVRLESEWQIEDAQIHQSAITKDPVSLVFGDPKWESCDFEFEFKADALGVDGRAIILFNVFDSKKFRCVGLPIGMNRRSYLGRFFNYPHDPSPYRDSPDPKSVEDTEWHHVLLKLRGSQIQLLLDGQSLFEENDEEFCAGRLGLATYRQPIHFRNVKVSGLNGEVLWVLPENSSDGNVIVAKNVKALEHQPEPQNGGSRRINLMKLIDLKEDVIHGEWTFSDDGSQVICHAPAGALDIPYTPPAEYDIVVRFVRRSQEATQQEITGICCGGGRQFYWGFNWEKGNTAGINMVNGKNTTAKRLNPTGVRRPGGWIITGKEHTMICKVRKDRVLTIWDGELIVEFLTNFSDLRLWRPHKHPNTLGIKTVGLTEFKSIELIEVKGFGSPLRDSDSSIMSQSTPHSGDQIVDKPSAVEDTELSAQEPFAKLVPGSIWLGTRVQTKSGKSADYQLQIESRAGNEFSGHIFKLLSGRELQFDVQGEIKDSTIHWKEISKALTAEAQGVMADDGSTIRFTYKGTYANALQDEGTGELKLQPQMVDQTAAVESKKVSIFNGKNLDGWIEEKGPPFQWKVDDQTGVLVGYSEHPRDRDYLLWKDEIRDFRLELEFQVDGRHSAGIAVRGLPTDVNMPVPDGTFIVDHPLIKISDNQRDPTGTTHWIASDRTYQPPLRTLQPVAGTWNSMVVEVRGESCSSWINGQLVIDTRLAPEPPEGFQIVPGLARSSGKFGFQANTGTIRFRNVTLQDLSPTAAAPKAIRSAIVPSKKIEAKRLDHKAKETEIEKGFVPLLSDKDLRGWQLVRGNGPRYEADTGILVFPADCDGHLFTIREYKDFILRFDFKLGHGGNNGVALRAPLYGNPSNTGMEIQILDDSAAKHASIQPSQRHGSVYGAVPARPGASKPVGEWNEQEILCRGRQVKVTLNGVVIVDVDLDSIRDRKILEERPGLARASGYLGFLGHNSLVELKNIRIKELP